jgi:hypothetical protein
MTIRGTNDVYTALIAAILTYTPSGTNPSMPATSLQNGAIGKRCWVLQAPDKPTFPYITLRLGQRQSRPGMHGLVQTAELEVKVWGRPRSPVTQQQVQLIGDQIETALVDWYEPTAPIKVYGVSLRDTVFYASAPADRDVILELLRFPLMMGNVPLYTEIGLAG